jgi:hypothetical protein
LAEESRGRRKVAHAHALEESLAHRVLVLHALFLSAGSALTKLLPTSLEDWTLIKCPLAMSLWVV